MECCACFFLAASLWFLLCKNNSLFFVVEFPFVLRNGIVLHSSHKICTQYISKTHLSQEIYDCCYYLIYWNKIIIKVNERKKHWTREKESSSGKTETARNECCVHNAKCETREKAPKSAQQKWKCDRMRNVLIGFGGEFQISTAKFTLILSLVAFFIFQFRSSLHFNIVSFFNRHFFYCRTVPSYSIVLGCLVLVHFHHSATFYCTRIVLAFAPLFAVSFVLFRNALLFFLHLILCGMIIITLLTVLRFIF